VQDHSDAPGLCPCRCLTFNRAMVFSEQADFTSFLP
jgi:hypothetical protein